MSPIVKKSILLLVVTAAMSQTGLSQELHRACFPAGNQELNEELLRVRSFLPLLPFFSSASAIIFVRADLSDFMAK